MTTTTKIQISAITGALIFAATGLFVGFGGNQKIEIIGETPTTIEEPVVQETQKEVIRLTAVEYKTKKVEMADKFLSKELSIIDLLYVDTPELNLYRAILNKEGREGKFQNIEATDFEDYINKIMIKLKG